MSLLTRQIFSLVLALTSLAAVDAKEIAREGDFVASVDDRYKCRRTVILKITSPSRELLFHNRPLIASVTDKAVEILVPGCNNLKQINVRGFVDGKLLRPDLGMARINNDWAFQTRNRSFAAAEKGTLAVTETREERRARIRKERQEAKAKKLAARKAAKEEKLRVREQARAEKQKRREEASRLAAKQAEERRIAQKEQVFRDANVPIGGEPVGLPGTVIGVWQGQYDCGYIKVGVTLGIEQAEREAITGRFKFYPMQAGDRRVRHGQYAMHGDFDKITGTVDLKPTKWINQAQGHRMMGLQGVLNDTGTSMAGKLQDRQCGAIQLTRIDLDPNALPEAQTADTFFTKAPATMAAAGSPAERCAAWVRWGSRIKKEYPDLKLMHTAINQVIPKIHNLFRKDIFQPFYGKTLAEIQGDEARQLRTELGRCNKQVPAELREELRAYFNTSLFVRPISDIIVLTQGLHGSDPRPKIAALEATRTWADRVLAGTKDLAPTEATIEKISTHLTKGDNDLKALLPSERQDFLNTMRERRSNLALAMLNDTVTGLKGIPVSKAGLDDIETRNGKIDQYRQVLVAEERDRLHATLNTRRDAILSELIAAKMKTLDTSGAELEDVVINAEWWKSFDQKFGQYRRTKPYQNAQNSFSTQRNQLLQRAQAEFQSALAVIKPGPHASRVSKSMLASLFPLRQDKQLPMYNKYQQLSRGRLAALKQEEERRKIAAEQERQRKIREVKLAKERAKFKGVHDCDTLAGHPDDPERTAPGVSDDAINVETALEACISAVEEHDKTPRFRFQLARVLLQEQMFDDALPLLQAAVEEEHAASAGYLGDMYQVGAGVTADWKKSMALYGFAVKGGFTPAKTALAALLEEHGRDIFIRDGYEEPMIVAGIYNGDTKSITYNPRFTRLYLSHMLSVMEPNCPVEVSPRIKGAIVKHEMNPKNWGNLFEQGLKNLEKALRDPSLLVESELVPQQASRDATILLRRHGCDSDVTKQFIANLEAYAKGIK